METPPLPSLPILDALFKGAPDAMVVVDVAGRIVLANSAAGALFGYRVDELIGADVDLLVPERQRRRHGEERDAFRRSTASGSMSAGRQLRARRKDGRLIPIDISLSTVVLAEGTCVIAIARDVAVYQRFLEACPVAIFVAGSGVITYANPAAFELVGADASAPLPSASLLDWVHPDDRPGMESWLATVRDAAGTIRPITEERVVRRDGSVRTVETSSVVVPNASEATILVAMQDVTERRSVAERERTLEGTLLQQQRLADIGAVTSKVVHDIANPVAGLIMGMQRVVQMLDRLPDDLAHPILPGVDRVLATARHLDVLLEEFRDYVRMQRLHVANVPLRSFLDELRGGWTSQAGERGVALTVSCGNDVAVRADAFKLRRAFDNLVKNALEAIGRGPGEVCITVGAGAAGKVVVAVRDTGPGVPEGMDPFALFETTKPDGTGLGLPSVRQIVEAHGGEVRLASSLQVGGAVFEVELPRARSMK